MPARPKSPCAHPGCHVLTTTARCEKHTRQKKVEHWKDSDKNRLSSYQRGYNTRWRRARLAWLREHPLCAYHLEQGKTVGATVVDHIKPHKGNQQLFWDKKNWQSLCKECHDRKTALEDSSFTSHNNGGRGKSSEGVRK